MVPLPGCFWRCLVSRSRASGLPMQWPDSALRWRGPRPSRAPFEWFRNLGALGNNIFEQTLLLGARCPA
eukprot:3286125-Prymnesium_polylepis.1